MPMSVETLHGHLAEAFPDAEIAIDDLAGDGDHYRARIVSAARVDGYPFKLSGAEATGLAARYGVAVTFTPGQHGLRDVAQEIAARTRY